MILTILCHGTQACSNPNNDKTNRETIANLDNELLLNVPGEHHVFCSAGPGSVEMPHLYEKDFELSADKQTVITHVQMRHTTACVGGKKATVKYAAVTLPMVGRKKIVPHVVTSSGQRSLQMRQQQFMQDTEESRKLLQGGKRSTNMNIAPGSKEGYTSKELLDMSAENMGTGLSKGAYSTARSNDTMLHELRMKANYVAGNIGGIGTSSTLVDCLNFVDAHIRAGVHITAINLAGWSRGGVQCVRLASSLAKHPSTTSIPVHIFAIDPVPGHRQEVNYSASGIATLPANVKRYVEVIALHDKRNTSFRPLYETMDVTDNRERVLSLPFPGDHSTLSHHGNASGKIVRHLLIKFLQGHGSKFEQSALNTSTCILNNGASLKLWEEVWSKSAVAGNETVAHHNGWLPSEHTALNESTSMTSRSVYKDKGFFYNAHHFMTVETFCHAATQLAIESLHTGGSRFGKTKTKKDAAKDLKKLELYPVTHERIRSLARDFSNKNRQRTLLSEVKGKGREADSDKQKRKLISFELHTFG